MKQGLQEGFQKPTISQQAKAVLRLLSSGEENTKKIASHLKTSVQSINKHKRKLKAAGFWEPQQGVSGGGFKALHYPKHQNQFRIHNVRVMYNRPIGITKEQWVKHKGQVLALKNISSNEFALTSGKVQTFRIWETVHARLHSSGIMVYLPEAIGSDPQDAELKLLKVIERIGIELNRLFSSEFFGAFDVFRYGHLRIHMTNYHIAHLNNSVAKELRERGKKLFVSVDGNLRYRIDYSWNIDEAEGLTVEHGAEDIRNMQLFVSDVLKEGESGTLIRPSEMREFMGKQMELNAQRSEAELLLAKNIKSHVALVKEIGKSVKELRSGIKEMKRGGSASSCRPRFRARPQGVS